MIVPLFYLRIKQYVKIINQADSMLTIDGQSGFKLQINDEIIIAKAPYRVKMIRLKEKGFYNSARKD